jgi:hypothetical protein
LATVENPTNELPTNQPAKTSVHPNDDGSITVEWFAPRRKHERGIWPSLGSVQVWFDSSDPPRTSSARVTLASGLTATKLQRFPWARILRVAEAGSRAFSPAHHSELFSDFGDDPLGRAFATEWPDVTAVPRRPGRRGHGDDFYRRVAQVFDLARAAGVRRPDEYIANEAHCSTSTVRGWAREARKRGYLARGQPGRPPSANVTD